MQDKALVSILDMTVSRLKIARQVALAKWDSQKPVEDSAREAIVIAAAVKEAQQVGISPTVATGFFSDQIEANKLVQYGLLADWRRAGIAPPDERVNLLNDIRPELDRLQKGFIQELAAVQVFQSSAQCPVHMAKLSGKYAIDKGLSPLYSIALDRALARFCEH